ncbi:sigma-70 family rna polymerase sigma factor : RNA polymerase sigma factor, sigma-70 family OS=Singulisphaera acidiphila (strain ATCC BAA-1392 / DSM 18658 / VKM B-2454 / MOB10) GN=Sinac_6419 PE=4 SV=1: Sigma70_r2: Sigma70_r4_2 [Gemmata massiliana]|uniref:ECF RNA polymerase sigma factor SigE n=1 Tax=Gemmata massiliana TaxID=1210884 RepID=A0A6P2D991_9BACT|nr:sigma-70 family RNA polymerase sigma factor [Gemmata massiliana]VTR96072.1 sigma-70 family rna polymerase sigma factor : RNA polymerase sigma factor, sigma-70 family OS=Singulisphaera acidiphila (strain ATCC BAA-1392 / DSM 18658 / VKM B-2454 / MOB10) GN=Sinac_6419 PE=4 SV=1: Sigma70_r2: Sigma70_r4_2 [Gemmata massiliana]
MNPARSAEILRQLERTDAPDADLLVRFVADRDTGAFEELVHRHGALVLGVCLRVTGHPQDAEDAFQATFLVLARRAATVRKRDRLWSWLYGTAFRVAWRARRAARRRRVREVTVSQLPEPHAPEPAPTRPELAPVLDEELAALPTHYREAIVLCDLRGASRQEAAVLLGVPEGTLSSRLANGRKRLAARLTRRGISLAVVALPGALTDAQAGITVPAELVTQTCGLVADFAANGAVPGPLARLTGRGALVRKTLVFGGLMVAVVASAVFAAVPSDNAPPNEPPKPPVVVQKPDAAPQPQADPKPGDQPMFASEPKLRGVADLSINGFEMPVWNATGTHLAITADQVVTPIERDNTGRPKTRRIIRVCSFSNRSVSYGQDIYLRDHEGFAGLTADGAVVTALNENGLISGQHELRFWAPEKGTGNIQLTKTVEIAPADLRMYDYAFAPDWKTYRTIAWQYDGERPTKIEVLEIDAVTQKPAKSLLKVDFGSAYYVRLSANGKRFAVVDQEVTKVTIFDVDRGEKVSEHTFRGGKITELPKVLPFASFGGPASPPPSASLVFSSNGKQLVVARTIGQTVVLNADTGDVLPLLEGTKEAHVSPEPCAFSSDNRLLVATGTNYKLVTRKEPGGRAREQTGWERGGAFLTVWDTRTGKVLKTWKSGNGARVAFNPVRPILAILEYNGESKSRLGFWDFAAEVEKK